MKTNVNSGIVIVSVLVLGALCGSVLAVDGNDLISHWKFDEGSGSIAYDSAGNNDGTVYGATWTIGQVDGALDFDGLDDYVDVGDPIDESLDFSSGQDFSVAAWFRLEPGATSGGHPILQKYSNSNLSGYAIFVNPGLVPLRVAFVTWGTSEIFVAGEYNEGSWNHVAGVRNQYSGIIRLYLNGVEVDTNNEPSRSLTNSANLRIGTNWTGNADFYGKIDDVRIYNRPLSADEIWHLYGGEPSGPVSHWRFDEGSGTTAYDSAGSNDGAVYGATWTTGQIDGALSFDGVEDYVRTANNVFTDAQLASGATLSAWFNTGSTAHSCIADNEGYLTLGVNHIYAPNPNKLCGIVDGGHHRFFSSSDVTDNFWHHAAIVWDGTNTAILYLDGVNESSGVSGPPTPNSKNRPFVIGAHSTIAAYFHGTIDDVRVYDKALSAEEIWQLYQKGLPVLVAIDIKPQSCPNPLNLKSRGALPVAVLGSEDFDVNNIDVASIRLADVAPIRSSLEDVATPVTDGNECECTAEGFDGYTDLTLKFKTQEIVEKLINAPGELVGGQMLSLTLTGALSDGTLIEGTDCVRLVGNVPRAIAAKRADINGDGVVNLRDLTIVSNYWLEPSEIE